MSQEPTIKEVTLEDGTKAYVFDQEQLQALAMILDNQLWWNGAWKRAKRVSVPAAMTVAILAWLASSWPWITHVARILTPSE